MLVDYAILKTIEDLNTAWKKKIHEYIMDHHDRFGIDSVSPQTIGRHVDKLQEEEVLSACIISPEGINREFIIGYQLTDRGAEHIPELREDIIEEHVLTDARFADPSNNQSLPRAALVSLLTDYFRLDDSDPLEDLDRSCLLTLVNLHRFSSNYLGPLEEQSVSKMAELVVDTPAIRDEVLNTNTMSFLQHARGALGDDAGDFFTSVSEPAS